ncbi:MAG: NAD(P)/FAD-dependent oxidoreductase [Candidatus Thermoplasmatota archaeon]
MGRVAVVGAGPAGCSAAIYLKRAGCEPLLFEKERIGGLALNAHLVEDYLGFPGGIEGRAFCALIEQQLARHEIGVVREEVIEIRRSQSGFEIETPIASHMADAVILATGTMPKRLEMPGLPCHYELKELPAEGGRRSVAVIGGGEAALDYALTLSSRGYRVLIIHRGKVLRANRALVEKAKRSDAIEVWTECEVLGAQPHGDEYLLDCTKGRAAVHYILCAVGRVPALPRLDIPPEELTADPQGRTRVPGLFLAGDLRLGSLRHIATACGDGIAAAVRALEYLEGSG